jgi:oligosaccharide amylase
MTRHLVLGNQSLLVNIDRWLQIRDIYYPHVGQENHLGGHAQKVGVYVDGRLSWINDSGWERRLSYKNDTLATESRAINYGVGIELTLEDNVYCEANIFLRKITVKNTRDRDREIRLFFYQDFHIYSNRIGDTAVYQMDHNVIVHYKRERYFLIGVLKSDKKDGTATDIDDFAIGQSESEQFEGTFRDAEDGVLSKNPIAQGSVDSTIGVHLKIPGGSSQVIYYYMTAGKNFQEVYKLNDLVTDSGPESLLSQAEKCQRSWINQTTIDLSGLDPYLATLFKRSLLIIKTQTDAGGAILAANDSDNLQFNRDTYSYMWSRDAALVSIALINAGLAESTRPFFRFCKDVLWWTGCLLHKYNPDKTLGSSWHPWVEYGKPSLPIQEDETGLVIYALWKYYEATNDIEFVRELYEPLVKQAAIFMNDYRYPNGMPMNSYDLWEERRGIFTFTISAVYAGLKAAEKLGQLFGDSTTCDACKEGYSDLKDLIISELFDEEGGVFVRGLQYEDGDPKRKKIDRTLDSSVYGIFEFGVLAADDPHVIKTMSSVEKKLWAGGHGGIARYENDYYRRQVQDGPGNSWLISTLWLAKWHIAKAKSLDDLARAWELINWVAKCALSTGIMPEQVHPHTGESISVAPLTWSHGEFVDAVAKFLEKKASLKQREEDKTNES